MFPTYSNGNFTVTSTGIELRLSIPAIEAIVTFKGLMFSVELPYSFFYNNTEGQCGELHSIIAYLHPLNSSNNSKYQPIYKLGL